MIAWEGKIKNKGKCYLIFPCVQKQFPKSFKTIVISIEDLTGIELLIILMQFVLIMSIVFVKWTNKHTNFTYDVAKTLHRRHNLRNSVFNQQNIIYLFIAYNTITTFIKFNKQYLIFSWLILDHFYASLLPVHSSLTTRHTPITSTLYNSLTLLLSQNKNY